MTANIRNAFDTFRKTLTVSDKKELEKEVNSFNADARLAKAKELSGGEKLFSKFVSPDADITYQGYKLEVKDETYTLSENFSFTLSPVFFVENSMSKAQYDKLAKTYNPLRKAMTAYMNGFIDETQDEKAPSIKALKESMEKAFNALGFAGHVSSKAIRLFMIDNAKANNKKTALRTFKFGDLITVLYNIHLFNVNNTPAPEK